MARILTLDSNGCRALILVAAGAFAASAGRAARATDRTWELGVSNCQAGTVTLTFELPPNPPLPVSIPIPNAMSATQKAVWIKDHINANGHDYNAQVSGAVVTFVTDARIKVTFSTGDTAERTDGLRCAGAQSGTINFSNVFIPHDMGNLPAIFTAGIMTDLGVLTVNVSATELNFQTDGPIICQALFQRLAPRAPQYGAQINYAGDRLEVYFDPAYTVTHGGIIFGTTSPTPGCGGTVIPLPPPPPPILPGDLNCDGVVNNFDIDAFVLALTNPSAYTQLYPDCPWQNGDINADGHVDNFDIQPMVGCLTGGCH